jgi:hypothetical protein
LQKGHLTRPIHLKLTKNYLPFSKTIPHFAITNILTPIYGMSKKNYKILQGAIFLQKKSPCVKDAGAQLGKKLILPPLKIPLKILA